MVIWIIGLPGSGKTTLGKKIQKEFSSQVNTLHIDGDDMRGIWGEDIGYELNDRKKNSKRIQKLSQLFEKQGILVVVSIMSIFEEHRKLNRKIFNEYKEVFLDVDLEVLKKRRTLYDDAINKKIKNVVGVDIKYEKPKTYDIRFKEDLDLDYMVEVLKKECLDV